MKRFRRYALVVLLFSLAPLLFASIADDMKKAIENFDLDKASSLVKKGYPLNRAVNLDDGTPFYALAFASFCYGGSPDIVALFLDNKADPNLHEPGEYSALSWAIRSMEHPLASNPMRKQVFRMLAAGAEVNYTDETTGRTPLHGAARIGDRELVQALLKGGADKTIEALPGWDEGSPADYARLGGWVELALELEGKSTVSYRSSLHYAAKTGNTKLLLKGLAEGRDPDEMEYRSNFRPLHYAVESGSAECVQALLDYGASTNVVNYAGISPLRDAVVYRKVPLAMLLLDAGAKADQVQTQGCGANLSEFMWAIEYGMFDLAEVMIKKNAIDARTTTALDQFWGYDGEREYKIAQILIQRGARVSPAHVQRLQDSPPDDYSADRAKLVSLLAKAVRNNAGSTKLFGAPAPMNDTGFRNKKGQLLVRPFI